MTTRLEVGGPSVLKLEVGEESTHEDQDENVDKSTCGICHRQVSRYTCPSCNIPYCSLTCFRNDSHSQCAEQFYKREVEAEIHTNPTTSQAERRRMMELLKRFEEEDASMDSLAGLDDEDENDEEEDTLAKRLEGVDLETISTDELWSRLGQSEREAFLKVVRDPDSERAKKLLREVEEEEGDVRPWWEDDGNMDEDEDEDRIHERAGSGEDNNKTNRESSSKGHRRTFGRPPRIMSIPTSLLKPIKSGETVQAQVQAQAQVQPALVYNLVAICMAYAYVSRHFRAYPLSSLLSSSLPSTSSFLPPPPPLSSSFSVSTPPPPSKAAKTLLQTLLPFLFDNHSRTIFSGGVDEVVKDIWSRLEGIIKEEDGYKLGFAAGISPVVCIGTGTGIGTGGGGGTDTDTDFVSTIGADETTSHGNKIGAKIDATTVKTGTMRRIMKILLGDAARLMEPDMINYAESPEGLRKVMLVLSDLDALLVEDKGARHKLQFYCGRVVVSGIRRNVIEELIGSRPE